MRKKIKGPHKTVRIPMIRVTVIAFSIPSQEMVSGVEKGKITMRIPIKEIRIPTESRLPILCAEIAKRVKGTTIIKTVRVIIIYKNGLPKRISLSL